MGAMWHQDGGLGVAIAGAQLAVPETRFIGREDLVKVAEELVCQHRVVSLTGAGGIGKTRLSLEIAKHLAGEFDGCTAVALDAVNDPADVAWRAASAFDLQDLSNRTAEDKVARHLGDAHHLLILDNCEHVLVAAAQFVLTLLARCPRLHILTTSREPLGIAGEHALQVPPLAIPQADDDFETILRSEAVSLLLERAAQCGHPVNPHPEDGPALAELCRRLDGLPLALELAGVRLRSLTARQFLDRLDSRFALLRGGGPGTLPRHKTLRNLVDWSYELCTEAERLLWARISVFNGGCDLEAAEAVAGFGELDPADVFDVMDSLVAKSLVIAESQDTGMRYRQLVTIRDYGAQLAEQAGESRILQQRHRDLLLNRAHRMIQTWAGPNQPASLAAMRADHADLINALEWSLTVPSECNAGAELAAMLRYHWVTGRFLSAGRRRLEQVLASPYVTGRARAEALWVATWVTLIQGAHDDAEIHLREASAMAEELDDDLLRGHVHNWTGLLHHFRGEGAEAVRRYNLAADAFERCGDVAALQTALFQKGLSENFGASPAVALRTCDRLIELSNRNGEGWCKAYGLWVRGLALMRQGNLAEARDSILDALTLQRDYLDGICIAHALELGAAIATWSGDHQRSAQLHGLADATWQVLGTQVEAFGPDLAQESHTSRDRSRAELGEDAWRAAIAQPAGADHEYARSGAIAILRQLQFNPSHTSGLTPREAQIAELVADGLSNKQIGHRLSISTRTVDGHVERILTKFKVQSRAQVVLRLRGT